jgi:hypothetical protein
MHRVSNRYRRRGWNGGGGGSSWISMCLPFIGEINLHAQMANASSRFSTPYSSGLKGTAAGGYTSAGVPDSSAGRGRVMTLQTWSPDPGNSKAGIPLAMISDGTLKTYMVAETRETTQAAWIDGSWAWVTASKGPGHVQHHQSHLDGHVRPARADEDDASLGRLRQDDTPAGPVSSSPRANLTIHGSADGHVGQVSSDIDVNLYFSLYTRGDNETIADAA